MEEGSAPVTVPGYRDIVEIGRGGFAVVYRGWQEAFERHVAIKVIATSLDADAQARFERECVAIGALSGHPNIVTVYEHGRTTEGHPYLVMEYLAGGTLAARVAAEGSLEWTMAADLGVQIGSAMAFAHSAAVLHRDIKPENVLLSPFGMPKLADFGIARVHGQHETRSGVVTASIAYAAPEIVSGSRATVAADIYSLGATLFAALSGAPPFFRPDEESLVPLIARIASDAVPDLRPTGVPDGVCRVVEQALAKDPGSRQESAMELARQLQEAQSAAGAAVTPLSGSGGESKKPSAAGSPPPTATVAHRPPPSPPAASPLPATPPRDGRSSSGRRRGFVPAAVVVAVVVVGGAVFALTSGSDDPDLASPTTTMPATATTTSRATTSPANASPTTAPVVPPPTNPQAARVLTAPELSAAALGAGDLTDVWVELPSPMASIQLPCNRPATVSSVSSAATGYGIPDGAGGTDPQLYSTLFGFADLAAAAQAFGELRDAQLACTAFEWTNGGVQLRTMLTVDSIEEERIQMHFSHTDVSSSFTFEEVAVAELVETTVVLTNLISSPVVGDSDAEFVSELQDTVSERVLALF